MPAPQLRPLNSVQTWTLSNNDVSIVIERDTGFMRSMLWKKKNVDLFAQVRQNLPGYIGGLRIYDEKDEKWYSDLNDPFAIADSAQAHGNHVEFKKQFMRVQYCL